MKGLSGRLGSRAITRILNVLIIRFHNNCTIPALKSGHEEEEALRVIQQWRSKRIKYSGLPGIAELAGVAGLALPDDEKPQS